MNAHDPEAVRACLAPECRFIDAHGDAIEGREQCVDATRHFFVIDPSYHIHIDSVAKLGNEILISGESQSDEPIFGHDRLWRVRHTKGQVVEFQNYGKGSPNLSRVLKGWQINGA